MKNKILHLWQHYALIYHTPASDEQRPAVNEPIRDSVSRSINPASITVKPIAASLHHAARRSTKEREDAGFSMRVPPSSLVGKTPVGGRPAIRGTGLENTNMPLSPSCHIIPTRLINPNKSICQAHFCLLWSITGSEGEGTLSLLS